MGTPPTTKEEWLRKLHQTSLPSFSESLQKLSNLDVFSDAHSAELSRIILKDPSLTAALLKLANSVQFNTSGSAIRTVSRGVMLIGHKAIHEICASCLLLDEFLKDGASITLQAALARSFHAAVQAKAIANARGDTDIEEIFISALLINIGEISVYSALGSSDRLVTKLIAGYPFIGGKERDLIGCYFNELTVSLCNSWGIAPMIAATIGGRYTESSTCRSILLANSFAASCEQQGFNSAVNTHIKTISRYCNRPQEEIIEKLKDAAKTAKDSLQAFGIDLKGVNTNFKNAKKEIVSNKVVSKKLMFDSIEQLTKLVQIQFDINEALQILLAGLTKGAGFRTGLVGLLNPQRTLLTVKHLIGENEEHYKNNFKFNCVEHISELNQKVLINQNILKLDQLREKSRTRDEIKKRLVYTNSIWGPLIVEGKVIGCIYADNGDADSSISKTQIQAFEFFVYLTKLTLNQLN